ncbi:MAG: glutamate racemase [Ruminococcaceae bacterium]|nr:glutamate racemase [Oscillospiraceae bacterium]
MYQKSDYIGVFDSGLGGISVLRHLKKILPEERYLYYGDSANAPYGKRTTQEVIQLTLAAVEKMDVARLKALVIACNTATAAAVGLLRQKYKDLIVVGIEPAIKPALDRFPHGTVGIMATEVTLREEKLDSLLHRIVVDATVCKIPAPGLVELVESGRLDTEEMRQLLRGILQPYADKLDALVLGCTHYPLVADEISRILGKQVLLFDGGEGTARETRRRLELAGLLHEGHGEILWENSSQKEAFLELSQKLLNQR